MRPDQFVAHFRQLGASAILRTPFEEAVVPAMEAAIRGGFRIVEFTLNTPGALDHVARFSGREDLVVGAGTVLTVEDARSAIRAGAKFLVSPVVDEAVIDEARVAGIAVMPGTHTPTEMLRAHRAGAQLQKLFPAPGSGPEYVRACLGPMPFLRIVPTSGVDGSNVGRFLAAGAWAVGFVASLFVPGDLEAGHFDRIERRATELLGTVRGARP
jgi:2-dehydro-3-deoxyphosphogluconate aldolase/(4S)-4-hydroxy-2-oxoglutarate aldolase